LIVGLATLGAFAQSQITSGTITTTVTDASGAIVPGAAVTVSNIDTNFERSGNTDANGRYVAPLLPPGRYTVTVAQSGFATTRQEDITLTVGRSLELTVELKVSAVQETIVVSGTPTVETTRTESSTTLNALTVESTPVLGRKFEDLLTLTPGVSIVQGPDGDEISFSGQRGIFNNISLDGGDYNNGFFGEQVGGQRAQIDISMDAIQEFQVIAAGGSAEFGRTGGGIVNVITKSGTNEVHGSVFHFQRLEALTADTSDGQPLTDFSREQFGATVGGPIVEDKAFFFGSFEQIIAELTRPNLSIQTGATACPVATPNILTDEALLSPFIGNPDCKRLALLDFLQTTLGQDDGNPVDRPIRNTAGLLKFDLNISPANQLAASYTIDRSKNTNETFDVATYGNSANGIEGPSIIQVANVNFFTSVSSNMFNEAHFTYSRESRPRAAAQSNLSADTAIGNLFDESDPASRTFRFGSPFFLQPGVDELFWRTQIKDNFTFIKGDHTVKVGGEWLHSLNDQVFRGFFTGRYIFHSVNGFLRYASPEAAGGFGPSATICADGSFITANLGEDCTLAGGPGFGSPLLLFLNGAGPTGPATDAAGASTISNEGYSFFAQDKWQVLPNLTLSFGLRWEAQIMPDTVDPTTTAFGAFLNDPRPTVLGRGGFPSDGTIPDQTDMIQPRIALAWDVDNNGKTVVRASWGIYNATQNMLTQVGSVTTNGIQQQTIAGGNFANPAVLPTWPNLPPVPVGGPGGFAAFTGVRVFASDYENPRIYTGNLAVEHEIYQDWSAYVDMTLSNGTNLTRFLDINNAARGGIYSDFTTGDPVLGEVFVTTSIGQSSYFGATVGMRKRFSQGYQLEWNYTWSQDRDDDSNERDPFTDRSLLNGNPFVNPDPTRESLFNDFGLSDRDITHKFNFIASAELPQNLDLSIRVQGRTAQPFTDPARGTIAATTGVDVGRNSLRKDNKFFSLNWRLQRPFSFGDGKYQLIPIVEMFNSFNNDNNINPLASPAMFDFNGFLRLGVGDPLQLQVAVKLTF
jgi:hypothetical protein